MLTKAGLAAMRNARGTNRDFKIVTANRHLSVVPNSNASIVTGTYREMQQGAKNASDIGHNGTNGRISTVLFEIDPSVEPNGVRWLRLHESWLPNSEVVSFDWDAAEMSSL